MKPETIITEAFRAEGWANIRIDNLKGKRIVTVQDQSAQREIEGETRSPVVAVMLSPLAETRDVDAMWRASAINAAATVSGLVAA